MEDKYLKYICGIDSHLMGSRFSARKFTGEGLRPEHLEKLADLCANFRPINGVRCCLLPQKADELFKFALGYGGHSNVPAAVAFVARKGMELEVGFVGQCFLLAAAAMGIDTCWVALFNKKFAPKFFASFGIGPDEEIVCVSPLGYCAEPAPTKAKKRQPMEVLAPNLPQSMQPWQAQALENARVAPSAVNCQPWRFGVEQNSFYIALHLKDKLRLLWGEKGRRIDCGIALAHVQCTVNELGLKGSWSLGPQPWLLSFSVEKALA